MARRNLLPILLVCIGLTGCGAASTGPGAHTPPPQATASQSLPTATPLPTAPPQPSPTPPAEETAVPSAVSEPSPSGTSDSVSLERDYEWYIDQSTTGDYFATNCMPTCVVMAATWYDAAFSGTVAEARAANPGPEEGWTNIDAFIFLTEHTIPCELGIDISETFITEHLDAGSIVLIGLDTSAISHLPNNTERLGKPFQSSFAHSILIKGYRTIREELYFEVYDPDSAGVVLADGSPIGKNRYYLASEIIQGALMHGYGYIAVNSAPQ